ncbi:MAG: ankyrin repeat domain-containing protein, partial [Polyangiaceae bacterium]|nr:ankyrin repeat domain-containing protein [Polyangiaceae bacterium]
PGRLKAALAQGVAVDSADASGATALYLATWWRCHEAMRFLLDAGANPNVLVGGVSTPLQMAMAQRKSGARSVDMLRAAGGRDTPLTCCSSLDPTHQVLLTQEALSGLVEMLPPHGHPGLWRCPVCERSFGVNPGPQLVPLPSRGGPTVDELLRTFALSLGLPSERDARFHEFPPWD